MSSKSTGKRTDCDEKAKSKGLLSFGFSRTPASTDSTSQNIPRVIPSVSSSAPSSNYSQIEEKSAHTESIKVPNEKRDKLEVTDEQVAEGSQVHSTESLPSSSAGHNKDEYVELHYTTPQTRQKHPTLDEEMSKQRFNMYDTVINGMNDYADARQSIIKHASVFDFRRIPSSGRNKEYEKDVKSAVSFFVGFCRAKSVLKLNKETKQMESATVSLFKIAGLGDPDENDVWQECTLFFKIARKLKETFMSAQNQRVKAEQANLLEEPARNYYMTSDAYQTLLNEEGYRLPFLSVIILVPLVFPTNSAGVERVFSATSWLKGLLSNRKGDATLNADLHVKFNDCNIDYTLI